MIEELDMCGEQAYRDQVRLPEYTIDIHRAFLTSAGNRVRMVGEPSSTICLMRRHLSDRKTYR